MEVEQADELILVLKKLVKEVESLGFGNAVSPNGEGAMELASAHIAKAIERGFERVALAIEANCS